MMSPSGSQPRDFARQQWSEPAKAPAGKVYGRGKGYFEYRIELPATVVKASSRVDLLPVPGGLQGQARARRLARTGQPARLPPDGQARTWSSTLAVSVNGRPVERITLPDDAADARGCCRTWRESSTAATASSSTARLADRPGSCGPGAPAPLVLRLAVPEDAPQRGASAFLVPPPASCRWTHLEIHTRDPLPADLGVDPDRSVAVPAGP